MHLNHDELIEINYINDTKLFAETTYSDQLFDIIDANLQVSIRVEEETNVTQLVNYILFSFQIE